MDLPPVTILMTTYFPTLQRRRVSETTLESWRQLLKYDGELRLHIADDGSEDEWYPVNVFSGPVTRTRQYRRGLGASLNAGFNVAFDSSPLVFYAVDDWSLTHVFDITPWAKALLTNETIGCIRFGPPHPGLTGRVEIISTEWQGWALRLDRHNYAYGDRPALYHQRFIQAYGPFAEGINALEMVRLYDETFARLPGPDIVLALPHPFKHLDSPSLSELEPR